MGLTFHFSISSCWRLYCLTKSSRTFFRPSELVSSAGLTSFTVLSTKTPLIMRKHFRSGGSGLSVSSTSLSNRRSGEPNRQPESLNLKPQEQGQRKTNGNTNLCSSVSCSTSPILWASCWRLFLNVVYCCCSSTLTIHHQMPSLTTNSSNTCLVVSSV